MGFQVLATHKDVQCGQPLLSGKCAQCLWATPTSPVQGSTQALKLTLVQLPVHAGSDNSSGAVSATSGAHITPSSAATAPGCFWPGSSAAAAAGSSAGTGGRRGMLTGFNTQLAVGPGGLVIGPSAAGSGMGLRPRPKSSHTAAVESIARRQAVLQVGLQLVERLRWCLPALWALCSGGYIY